MATIFLSHPACAAHRMAPAHPECPDRLSAIETYLIQESVLDYVQPVEARHATAEELRRVHSADYLDHLAGLAPEEGLVEVDIDTQMGPGTMEAALRAAGAVVHAVDVVLAEGGNAFCNVRPPGHHATREGTLAFCCLNNVAVGAAHALEAGGLERVAIVDFDVHHGNGTEDIFRDDERVMFCSIYQEGLYPVVEPVPRPGRYVSVGMAPGSGSVAFREVVDGRWLPALEEFAPQMILVSAGFDAHTFDTIGDLDLVDDDFRWVTRQLLEVARRHGGGRLVSCLEGGYELATLARVAGLHIRELMGV